MKIKNIWKKDINVDGKLLEKEKTIKIDEKTQEIKNLEKNKYVEVIKDE